MHKKIFPECVVSDDSAAAHRLSTTKGGTYIATGCGGSITGRGADLLLIDDPIKSPEDANSATFRRSLQTWYEGVAYPRLEPSGAIVLIQTRWHVDDLAGWLLREHVSENWKVISMPAIAESDEGWRKPGDALWPERFDLEALARIREAIGNSAWQSLYQQRPVTPGGNVFKEAWFRRYRESDEVEYSRTILSVDSAYKSGEQNDYSAVVVISEARTGFHIRLVSRGRWDFPSLQQRLVALAELWHPSAVLIEDSASGQSLLQVLQSTTRLPVIGVRPIGDQLSRASAFSPMVESGRLFLPEAAPWLGDYLAEMTEFPASSHDDQVDATVQSLKWLGLNSWTPLDSENLQSVARLMNERDTHKQRLAHHGSQHSFMNVRDMEEFEDGTDPDGGRYTMPARSFTHRKWRGF